jgi:hypothetical protein
MAHCSPVVEAGSTISSRTGAFPPGPSLSFQVNVWSKPGPVTSSLMARDVFLFSQVLICAGIQKDQSRQHEEQ